MYECVCVFVYILCIIYACRHMCLCVYICLCMDIWTYLCINPYCMYACMYVVHMCLFVYVYIYICECG